MSAITALINVMGRIVLVLLEAHIRMVFALGQALSATIAALWQARTGGTPKRRYRPRPSRRPRKRYASNRR